MIGTKVIYRVSHHSYDAYDEREDKEYTKYFFGLENAIKYANEINFTYQKHEVFTPKGSYYETYKKHNRSIITTTSAFIDRPYASVIIEKIELEDELEER